MYVTRPLSMYRRDPSALSWPPEGPNSGILVIQDEDAEPTCCFGLCTSDRVSDIPFPQNKNLKVVYTQQHGEHQHVDVTRTLFIPVLNQPLSANQYYVIAAKKKRQGKAYVSSKEEDIKTYLFCIPCVSDVEPETLDVHNIYQKFEVRHRNCGGFTAKSLASNGVPPKFLRRKGWRVRTSSSGQFLLEEAPGLDKTVRAHLPDFNFPLSEKLSRPVTAGKWYVPFMFIKEGDIKEQITHSAYYQMILEQQWEQIVACDNEPGKGGVVTVDTEMVEIAGRGQALNKKVIDEVMWFETEGEENSIGMSLAVVERIKWEEKRFGWIGEEGKVKVKKLEEFSGTQKWRSFGCYVLVERFVLKRMNGSLVLTWSFRHTNRTKNKWE
ncbi:hypothetical protein K2173_016979 [Erythroxylum novogranatense]|uniref:Uncharacterized protein n=1 Tax=Erythroxylum novogranatense TaxID=1862640 RepID=A0AAV8U877_9ROSI|nr:hypothetical protein K2173_016979 [Erythroxylum novogranatense]